MIRESADALGWAAAVALAISIAWPYITRGRPRTPLRPHFWIGYVLAPAALAHGWASMKSGQARGANAAGTYLVTLALLPLAGQIFVGRTLRRSTGAHRETARRWHFALMLMIALLVASHLALVRW